MTFIKRHRYLVVGALAMPLLVLSLIFHDNPILFTLGTVELFLIAIVVNTFVIVYFRRNWRANAYGRALMYSKISLAILANLSLITALLGPDWPYRGVVRLILFGLICGSQFRLLYLLFRLGKDEPDYQGVSTSKTVKVKEGL